MEIVCKYILTIVPKLTSLLSILGSSMIISQVLRSRRNRGHIQQRLVCAMSIIDVTVSTAWFLTPFLVTKDMDQFLWSVGNKHSCRLQGFIVQMSIGGVLYNASLSLYYLLVIKYGFQKRQMVLLEKFMHAFALTFGVGTATAALALDMYQDANWDCWISPAKQTFQWAFFFAPLWLAIIFVVILMLKIFLHVRQEERNSMRFGQIGDRVVRLRKTRAVAKQGALYVGAFFVTWLFPTISRVFKLASGDDPPLLLVALSGSFIPIQGFFNALVYFRLRFLNCVRDNPNRSVFWVVRTIVTRALCCCCDINSSQLTDGLDIEPRSSSQNKASAVSAEPEAEPEPPDHVFSRRISLTSLHRGIRGLQTLYVRTNALFFGAEDEDVSTPVPKSITIDNDETDPSLLHFSSERAHIVEMGETPREYEDLHDKDHETSVSKLNSPV